MIDQLKQTSFFKEKDIEKIVLIENQGYCNENYLVVADNTKYIVRQIIHYDVDRNFEWKILHLIYDAGITAKPLLYDTKNDFMVFVFLEGVHKNKFDKNELKLLAKTLQKVHSIQVDAKPIEITIQNQIDKVLKAFEVIANYPKEYVLCHNDLNPQNLLWQDKELKLIDWEYAGVNDRYFDLASVCVEFGLEKEDEIHFLESYFTIKTEMHYEKLKAYKVIYKALCSQWFEELVQNK